MSFFSNNIHLSYYYIYLIENVVNNKIYVGQTKNLSRRWSRHKANAFKYNCNDHLYHAMRKYGLNNFKFSPILKFETLNEVNEAEEFWIKFFNSRERQFGYNAMPGGDNRQHSEYSKIKMSIARVGKPLSSEIKKKIGLSSIGKTVSSDVRNRISLAGKGKHSGKRKLNTDTVALIRNEYSLGEITQKELALRYGVCNAQISRIILNKTWVIGESC